MMELKIREMTPQERLYCYSQSLELEIKTGCIGHLRANLGVDGENFYSSWTDHWEDLKTQSFKEELDTLINTLTQLREQLVQPATEEALGAEILISDYTATAAVFEDYTASRGVSALTAYYDGDICAFAETEKLLLMDYNAVMRKSADEDENGTAFKAQAEALRQKLQPFFFGSENRMHRVMADTVRPNTGVYGRLTDGALYCFAQAKGEE